MSDHPTQPSPDENILNVEIDLDAEDLPPVPAAPVGGKDLLVIDADSLTAPPLPTGKTGQIPRLPQAPGKGAGEGVGGEASPVPALQTMGPPDIMGILGMVLAGALGAFIAWMLVNPFVHDSQPGEAHPTHLLLYVLAAWGLFYAVVGGFIGAALGAVEGINSRSLEKACWGGLLGLGIGAVGGFFGGVLAQALYGGLVGGAEAVTPGTMLVRGLGWAFAGLFIGLGQGAWTRATRKMINGMIGGFIGGLIGGLMFDPLHVLILWAAHLTGGVVGGGVSRLVAIVVMGAACGAAIGLVEQARKEAWLRIIEGPLTGKQFIIYRSPTTIGTSPKCDITLAADKAIAPQHLQITQQGGHYLLADLGSATGTRVNGQSVQSRSLRSGDRISLGSTTVEYAEKAIRGAP